MLHEGFLQWAYTLFLQGSTIQAEDRLRTALRIDPGYEPSPVVLRPDLYAFYQEERAVYLESRGDDARTREKLDDIFPELQPRAGAVGPDGFIPPILGIGLERLGHPDEAAFLRTLQIASLTTNLASVGIRVAVFSDLTPTGDLWHDISVGMNVASFFVFWPALVADIVATLTLQARYTRQPELRPRPRATVLPRRPPPPIVGLRRGGLTVSFW